MTKVHPYDLSETLPPRLNKRVVNILKSSPSHLQDPNLLKKTTASSIEKERPKQQIDDDKENAEEESVENQAINDEDYNENTDPDIVEAEKRFKRFELKLEPPAPTIKTIKAEGPWSSEFVTKKIHERVKWQSKFHHLEIRLTDKPIFEQADDLIDIAAADFSDWINSLSSDSNTNISKELIKELFPIGLEGDATKALYVGPKQIQAIPDDVGHTYNLPHVSISFYLTNIF